VIGSPQPRTYGLMCFVLMTRFAPTVFLWVYGIMLLGYAGYVALALPKWRDSSLARGVPP